MSAFLECLGIDPDHVDCLNNLARLLLETGDAEGAITIFEGLADRLPGDDSLQVNIGALAVRHVCAVVVYVTLALRSKVPTCAATVRSRPAKAGARSLTRPILEPR